MPNLGAFHPQVVHFVVSLLLLGVAFRIVSLTGRLRFTNVVATTLLLIGTAAAVVGVQSGTDAHGPVERIPGTRDLVIDHEEHGKRARNVFLVVAAIELVGLVLSRKGAQQRAARIAYAASALVGAFGAFELYETAEHGGKLVYSYAGGPGLRTGDTADVERLLLAGLYNQSQVDRKAGRGEAAATLVDEMTRRFPNDTTIRFLHVESLLLDRKNPAAARAAIDSIVIPASNMRLQTRQASLKADIYLALGQPDSARAVLAPLVAASPQNTRLKAKLDSIK